jgi:hypothetical protein
MSPSNAPNPERRSTAALVCFVAGAVCVTLAWFLGVGGVMTIAMGGGDPAAIGGGLGMVFALVAMTFLGITLLVIGGVWMLGQVVADQRGEASEKRYRDVER